MEKRIEDLQTRRLSRPPVILIFEVSPIHTETHYIPDVSRALIDQLLARGLMLAEIEGLMRDALNILCQGGIFTMDVLNRKLEALGWGEDVVDQISFRLIVHLLEREYS